jgi:hypothetical protein
LPARDAMARVPETTIRWLLRWICLQIPVGGAVQRSILLDPVALHGDIGDAEPGIFGDANRIEFRRIALLVNCAERTNQGSIDRLFPCSSEAPSRAGTSHPDKMPARVSDHRIEDRGRDLVHQHPVSAKRFPQGIQTTRQDTSLAQENGMELHACPLLDTVGAAVVTEPGEVSRPIDEAC